MRALGLSLLALLTACGGEPITTQLTEPVRASGAQFHEGELPGAEPLTAADIQAGLLPSPPNVTAVDYAGFRLVPGEVGRSINGRTSLDAVAVGLRVAGAGSGYWVLPVGGPDALNNDEPTWSMNLSFSHDLVPGNHALLLAALDAEGRSGTQSVASFCMLPEIPDNGNACAPEKAPPAFVVSLEWDAQVDLDLKVVTPAGKTVDAKHPSTALSDEDGEIDPSAPGTGLIDVDSYSNCIPDSKRRENLVFQEKPPPGTYLVYANLFDACGQSSVRYQVSFHSAAAGSEPETYQQLESFRQGGALLAVQANGGKALGTFVTEFNVQ
jgi:hypothetical protein